MRWVRWLALCVATGLVVLLAVAVAVEAARRPAEAVGDGGAGALVLQVAAGVALWSAGLQLALRQGAHGSGCLPARLCWRVRCRYHRPAARRSSCSRWRSG